METGKTESLAKRAAVNGLAVVGFLALIFVGITLAVYAARFVPTAVTNLGTAAVYFASLGNSNTETELTSVTDETVIPFGEETESQASSATAETAPTMPVEAPEAFRSGTETSASPQPTRSVYVIGTTSAPAPYGLPDLTVTITERGYLETGSSGSYKKADEVPDGKRGAIKFVVENKGTNVAGVWKFTAQVPTTPTYTFTSPEQDSIAPGARVEYVLGFDRAKSGDDRTIIVTVDSAKKVEESNEKNNDDSETLVIN